MGYISVTCGVSPHHPDLNLPNLLNPLVQTCTKHGDLVRDVYLVPTSHPMHPKYKAAAVATAVFLPSPAIAAAVASVPVPKKGKGVRTYLASS